MLVAEVILPLPLPGTFTYAIPEVYREKAAIGSRVLVSFGKTKFLTGAIQHLKDEAEVQQIKPILDALDDEPVLTERQLEFFDWISHYYMCTIGEVMNAALPSGFKLSSESLVALQPGTDLDGLILTDEERWLIARLKEKDLPMASAEKIIESDDPIKFLRQLQSRGVVQIIEKVKEKYSPRTEKRIRLTENYLSETALDNLLGKLEKREKQIDVLLTYLRDTNVFQEPGKNQIGLATKELLASGSSESSLKTLIKNGVFEEWNAIVDRFGAQGQGAEPIPALTLAQEEAHQKIQSLFSEKSTVLLKGVTGSGKTAIYMHLIDQAIMRGEKALYLLPEIALTTQIITRFRRVFGDKFGVYHSKFSDNERVEVWKKCRSGAFDFVIGVRSAIYLPIKDLSLIIVDEEHETSYKQQDPAPRYNARDAAVFLAHVNNAKVLLGSGTPSLESYKNALDNKYGLVELTERFNKQPPPPLHLVDLSKERKKKTLRGNFSGQLLETIQKTIEEGKQILLFQNRRGYAPFLLCDHCSHSPKCPNCSVSLTYHIYKNTLICHYCGYNEPMYESCDQCNQGNYRTIGTGTEKIEEELQILLPEAKIQRMDLDSTRSKYAYQDIIDRFEQQEIDVLVGTQMISKGLDFDHVKLVGVFDADRMIHFPDFRSHERAFHLIVQVSGRAGRKDDEGQVLVQTHDPEHRLLKQIGVLNFEGFLQDELRERRQFRYPPFFRLIVATVRHKEKKVAQDAADELSFQLRKNLAEYVSVPIEPLISKIRNYYRYQVVIRIPKEGVNLSGAKQFLLVTRDRLLALPSFKSVRCHFDVDPL